jgi:hypothetical protein
MDEIDKLLAGIEPGQSSAPKDQRLNQLKIQREELARSNATEWLAKLSSVSEEGRWFEEFACHYESRLEAALDYLAAIAEAESSN